MRTGTPGFVGERLKEGREARGLTATLLAERIGVSKQLVSLYESGEKTPSPDVMRRISDSLNLAIHFFLCSPSAPDPGVTFFRARATTSKVLKACSERRYAWLRDIVGLIRQYVRLPLVNYPNFNPPADPLLITDEMIGECASATRRYWGLGDGPISDVVRLLENNGTIIARHEMGSSDVDAYSRWCSSDQTPYIILGKDKGSAARSRHDVSHELGHLVIHRNVPETTFNLKAMHAVMERQAHRFASSFLMPEPTFAADFYAPTLDAFRALKPKWKVSIASMLHRSIELRLISEEAGVRLWANLARRKWKTHEPLDDILEPESPKILERSLKLLSDSHILGMTDISHEFGFSDSDIESLVGLSPGSTMEWDRQVELKATPSVQASEPRDQGVEQEVNHTIRFPTGRRTGGIR